MPQYLPESLSARVRNIKDVADDLTGELFRAHVDPASAIHDMVMFIRTEAETILKRARASPVIDS